LLPFCPEPSVFSSAVENVKIKIRKTVILPVVLYGCETWSLTLREEHRLRVFGNRVLGTIFGPKRDEVKGEWRKLCKMELHNVYPLPYTITMTKSRRMRWVSCEARMWDKRSAYRILVEKPEGKTPVGRARCRWVDNIKMDLRKRERYRGVWIGFIWLKIGTGGGLL
jgi:hypothetical protein